ncbi:Gfo/Idh/MocA family oxidoreductase [Scytonema sp. UIC 10036]|uniref:Gfo/Idh/MocA family oxidoreductase n=1 Tax=Scytonema sp. UIC 10036 TaxID=2304196 RepID=UPI001FAA0C9A|nr:Gfo/Idh/MocA family oxidoreductase [Scytonema sp. UIC 10036]
MAASVQQEDVDLVVICHVNRDHGAVVREALKNGKHVVVEYPLSFDVVEAEELIALSKTQTDFYTSNILKCWVGYIKL